MITYICMIFRGHYVTYVAKCTCHEVHIVYMWKFCIMYIKD